MDSFDAVLDKYFPSGIGLWQAGLLLTLIPIMQQPFVLFGQLNFLAPGHRCAQPKLDSLNWSFAQVTNLSVPFKEDPLQPPGIGQAFQPCREFNLDALLAQITNETTFAHALELRDQLGGANLTTRSCAHGIAFDTDAGPVRQNLVVDYEVLCDRSYLQALSNSAYFVGMLLGYFVTGSITDNFGRRRPILITTGLTILLLLGTSAAPDIWTFIVLRTALAAFLNIAFMIAHTLISELASARARSSYTTARKLYGAIFSRPYLVLVTWYFSTWRVAYIVFGAPFLLILPGLWTCLESPRWLISQGRVAEAEAVMQRMLRTNRRTLSEHEANELRAELHDLAKVWERKAPKGSPLKRELRRLLRLVRSPLLRGRMFFASLLFTLQAFVFYGVAFYAVRLRGDPYLIAVVAGVMGVPGNLLQYLVYRFFDRKRPIIAFMGSATLLFSLGVIFMATGLRGAPVIAVSTTAVIFLDALFSMLYVRVPELFPSNLRGTAMALSATVARFGSIIATYVERLDELWPPLPLLLFALGAASATASACFLPPGRGEMEDVAKEKEEEDQEKAKAKIRSKDEEKKDTEEAEGKAPDEGRGKYGLQDIQ